MTEVLIESQREKDPIVDLNEFYRKIIKNHIESRASDEVTVVSFAPNDEVVKKDIIAIPLDASEISQISFTETAILDENLYILLNQLVRERFLVQPSTKLIPEVGLTDLGFIVGTAVKRGTNLSPIALLCRLPSLKFRQVPKSNFSEYEVGT